MLEVWLLILEMVIWYERWLIERLIWHRNHRRVMATELTRSIHQTKQKKEKMRI